MRYFFHQASVNYINSINEHNFDEIALELFHYQYEKTGIYRSFVDTLHIDANTVKDILDIPFLPINFFRTHKVLTNDESDLATVFESSSTTSDTSSKHYVRDIQLYEDNILSGINEFYPNIEDHAILALLPSYLERSGSSLVHMAELLINRSKYTESGFYLNEFDKLHNTLLHLEERNIPTLLIGVTFGLLDFAEQYSMNLKHTTVMETGGMKGRRKELTREEVHQFLINRLNVEKVHSEYGMTELLSQAYSHGDGIFTPAKTMKLLIRNINDPFELSHFGSGCLNIIDLANIHSCSFIATDDIGKIISNNRFEVQGRIDHSALRGCNLMAI